MAQISEEMVGMTTNKSIQHMEQELELMELHDGDYAALGIIMANMSMKQSMRLFGVKKTMATCKSELQ